MMSWVQVFFENRRAAVETEPAQVFCRAGVPLAFSLCVGGLALGLLRISSGFRPSRSSDIKWRGGNMIKSSLGFIV